MSVRSAEAQDTQPQLISRAEAAQLLGVHVDTVTALHAQQALPGYQIGKRIKFRREEVLDWMKGQRRVVVPRGGDADRGEDRPAGRPAAAPASDFAAEARELRRRRKAKG